MDVISITDMAKRKYTKRSNYWDKFNKKTEMYVPIGKNGEVQPDLLGEPFYTSDASLKRPPKLEGNLLVQAIYWKQKE